MQGTEKKKVFLCFVFSLRFVGARDLFIGWLLKASVLHLFTSNDAFLQYLGTA